MTKTPIDQFQQRDIERLEYWQGQLLRRSDFEAQRNADDQRRWWHNRSLHRAYGVSLGLGSRIEGDRLAVDCGLAHDCEGRELLVATQARVRFPKPNSGVKPGDPSEPVVLVLRNSGEHSRIEDGLICAPCSPGVGAEFVWIRISRFDGRSGVPIALMNWNAAGAPELDPAFEAPRSRAIARPHNGSGFTPPGGTVWETWTEIIPDSLSPPATIGLQTEIDTSAAGFAEVPIYIAQLNLGGSPHLLPPPICRIDRAAPDSFLFRLWFPRIATQIIFSIPKSKVAIDNANTVTLLTPAGFQEGDAVRPIGKKASAILKKINDDNSIELDPRLEDLKDGDTLRLAYLASLDRVAAVLKGQKIYPGMEVQIDGTDANTAALVSRRASVRITPRGDVEFIPPDIPSLLIGDAPGDVPRISTVSAQSVDFPLVAQDLGWYVCWIGAICEGGPLLTCGGPGCEISAGEVC